MTDDQFLIEKRGFYYRPNSSGYTGVQEEAGRNSFEEAAVHGRPKRSDGSLDGIFIWREKDAPEMIPKCTADVRMVHAAKAP